MTLAVRRTEDLSTCHALRRAVFTEEQGVPVEIDVDGTDDGAVHFIATLDGTPVGTARFLILDDVAKIGRVCVLKEHRGKHIGVALIEACMSEAKAMGLTHAKLGAQQSAIGFYERLGYVAEGDMFLDADIPHRMMSAPL